MGLPVTCPGFNRSAFFLVAAFGRRKFRLSSDSAGVLLQAAIGGFAPQFNVSQLGDRTFKFAVSNKSIGFFVLNLRSFCCDAFKVSFFLWGNGGHNSRHEFNIFLHEEASSWFPASSKPGRRSLADVVKSPPLSGANVVQLGSSPSILRAQRAPARRSVFQHIVFPSAAGSAPSSALFMAVDKLPTVPCSRYLSTGHERVNCRWPIRCCACRKPDIFLLCVINPKSLSLQRILARPRQRRLISLRGGLALMSRRSPPPPARQSSIRLGSWLVLFVPRRNLCPT